MPFSPAEQLAILTSAGDDITVSLFGVEVSTIRGKFRRDVDVYDPYTAGAVKYMPGVIISSADAALLSADHTLTIGGVIYQQIDAPQEQNDGFVRIFLKIA
jgi:hypothetical protein